MDRSSSANQFPLKSIYPLPELTRINLVRSGVINSYHLHDSPYEWFLFVPRFLMFFGYPFKFKHRSVESFTIPISEKLEISVDLRLKTSRDSYATTLKRSGKSRDEIGEMMGHSNSQVTEHYLASLDMDKTWEINEGLF